jgi:hypothetical protein
MIRNGGKAEPRKTPIPPVIVEQSDAIPIILRGLAEKPIAGARRSQ